MALCTDPTWHCDYPKCGCDKPPEWTVRQDVDTGRQRVCSADFTHDVELILTGDFADANQAFEYALRIADKLNRST